MPTHDLKRIAISTIAAILLSTTCIVAVAAPVDGPQAASAIRY